MFEPYKYTINCLCNYIYPKKYNVFFKKHYFNSNNSLEFFQVERSAIGQVSKFFFCKKGI